MLVWKGEKNCMNNCEFAIQFESDIKAELLINASQQESIYIEKLFESYIGIEPRSDENHFSIMNVGSQYPEEYRGICLKISNIKMNLREAIALAIETALYFKIPETSVDLIKIALVALLKLYVLLSVKIETTECVLLYYLYLNNAYKNAISEQKILCEIENKKLNLTKNEYYIAVKKLSEITAISIINDGAIKLKEKIYIKY